MEFPYDETFLAHANNIDSQLELNLAAIAMQGVWRSNAKQVKLKRIRKTHKSASKFDWVNFSTNFFCYD